MGSKLAGRNTLLNDKMIEILASCIALGMSNKDAIKAAGISEFTYYKWMKVSEEEEENRAIGIVEPKNDIYLQFSKSIDAARAKGQRVLLQRVYKDAFEPQTQTTTKKEYDGSGKLVRETVTEVATPPNSKAAQWILERRWRGEYAKHTIQHKVDWAESIKNLLESGTLSKEELAAEIGEDLAEKLFAGEDLKKLGDGNEFIEGTFERGRIRDDESGDASGEEEEGDRGKTKTPSPRIAQMGPDLPE